MGASLHLWRLGVRLDELLDLWAGDRVSARRCSEVGCQADAVPGSRPALCWTHARQDQGADAAGCRVAECPYLAEPGGDVCAMHGALLGDRSKRDQLTQAAGQLDEQHARELVNVATVALLLSCLALVLALAGIALAVLL